VAQIIPDVMQKYTKSFPSIDNLPPFYVELIDLTIGKDQLKKSLASLNWCGENVKKVCGQYSHKIFRTKDIGQMNFLLKSAYGRISSIVNQISSDLDFLKDARKVMNDFPTIDPNKPMTVVAGLPNVGKSQLVRAISSGRPKVATYPFTTKKVTIGHFKVDRVKYQIMDTPGLLDRDVYNEVEKQAVLALETISEIVLVIMDLNGYCGYPIEDQIKFYESIKAKYEDITVIPIESKVDIGLDYTKNDWYELYLKEHDIEEPIRVSAESSEGIEELRQRLVDILTDSA
jgi:nucleolar GTP-binding protein